MSEKNLKKIYHKLIEFQKISTKIFKKEPNLFLKTFYADLASIQDAIKPALTKTGLGYTQILTENGIKTIIFTADGEEMEAFYPITYTSKAQETGSLITYARRYSLVSILGLIIDAEDDDGNKASNHPLPSLTLVALQGEVIRLVNTASAISGTEPNKMLGFYLDKLKAKTINQLNESALKSLISALHKQIDKHTETNTEANPEPNSEA